MLINNIRGFNSFLNKKSNRLSTFEVFFDALSSLIDPKTANQNETLQKITSQAEFNSIDELNAFFKKYFDFHNDVIAFLNDERLEQNKINRLSKEIISTLDKENAPQILEHAIMGLLLKICDVYSLDIHSADFEKDVRKTFNDDTVVEAFNALSVLPQILHKNDDPDIELDKILGIAVSVVAVFDVLRKASIASHGFDAVKSEPEKIGRNEPCPCKSGKKYKKCCMQKDKNPFAALEKIAPQKERLNEKEIEEFYALWSRVMNFINRVFCKMTNQRYARIYEKDENGKYALTKEAYENSHYLNVRRFADDNWPRLMDEFIHTSRLSQKNLAIIKEWKAYASLKQFFSFEKNISGGAIFKQVDNNKIYFVHKLYDDLQKLLPEEPQSFEAFLLPFKERIITDGAYAVEQIHMGANMQKIVRDEYIDLREKGRLLQRLEEKRESGYKIFQLKISLKDAKPPLWRRVELSSEISYYGLHMIIQALFGWEGSHLYEFDSGRDVYIDSELDEVGGRDVRDFSIHTDLIKEGDRIYYLYDFGDNWEHEIKLEKILTTDDRKNYPVCTTGRRSDPIEDAGGIEMLNQLYDPQEKFDITAKNRALNELFSDIKR